MKAAIPPRYLDPSKMICASVMPNNAGLSVLLPTFVGNRRPMQADYPFFLHVIREAVSNLPEALEKPCHGTPGFYAGKKLFARVQDDLQSLAVYTKRKAFWLAKDSGVYFTTPHFDGYDYVLVQLASIDPDALKDLLVEGWRARATKRAVKADDERVED